MAHELGEQARQVDTEVNRLVAPAKVAQATIAESRTGDSPRGRSNDSQPIQLAHLIRLSAQYREPERGTWQATVTAKGHPLDTLMRQERQ